MHSAHFTRREALAAGLAAVATSGWSERVALRAADNASSQFVAFSLRRAGELAGQAAADTQLKTLGGLTRVAGTVYDPAGDVILVGLRERTLPTADFDYLVTALQARFERDEFPLVSIDPVPDTPRTRQQQVRFVGPLADSAYGRDLLACDVLLKRYSLSLVDTIPEAPPYHRLLEQDVQEAVKRDGARLLGIDWKRAEEGERFTKRNRGARIKNATSYQSRFWFYAKLPYRSDCRPDKVHPEVFVIRQLQLCLLSDPVFGGQAGQYAREEFTRRFTENLAAVAAAHPILQRLKIIYDLTAAADAIRVLDRHGVPLPWIRGLLGSYRVAVTPTERQYPLQQRFGQVQRSDRLRHMVSISGGIEFVRDEIAEAVENLGYGVLTELRTLVLRSRPAANALCWRVPLEGWSMPNADDLRLPAQGNWNDVCWRSAAGGGSGCSLLSQSVTLAADRPGSALAGEAFHGFSSPIAVPPLKGVSMRMDVTEDSFRQASDGSLQALQESLQQARHGGDSLSWPAGGPLDKYGEKQP